jgi:hypothetical protein
MKKTESKPKKSSGAKKEAVSKKGSVSKGNDSTRMIMYDHYLSSILENQHLVGLQVDEKEKIYKKNLEETRKELEELNKRFNQHMSESSRELEESTKNVNKKMSGEWEAYHKKTAGFAPLDLTGGLGGKGMQGGQGPGGKNKGAFLQGSSGMGKLAEQVVCHGLTEQFKKLGLKIDSIALGMKILDDKGNAKTEFDMILNSAKILIAVEAKDKPAKKDIDIYNKKLSILKDYRKKYGEKRKICGAIMGKSFDDKEKQIIQGAGLYVIEQSGNNMKISAPK